MSDDLGRLLLFTAWRGVVFGLLLLVGAATLGIPLAEVAEAAIPALIVGGAIAIVHSLVATRRGGQIERRVLGRRGQEARTKITDAFIEKVPLLEIPVLAYEAILSILGRIQGRHQSAIDTCDEEDAMSGGDEKPIELGIAHGPDLKSPSSRTEADEAGPPTDRSRTGRILT